MTEAIIAWLAPLPLIVPDPVTWCGAVLVVLALVCWFLWTRHLGPVGQVLVLLAGPIVALLAWVGVDVLWRPFADGVGKATFTWIGAVVLVIAEILSGWSSQVRAARRAGDHKGVDSAMHRRTARGLGVGRGLGLFLVGLALAVVAFLTGAVGVNSTFGAYPTLGAVMGWGINATPLPPAGGGQSGAGASAPQPGATAASPQSAAKPARPQGPLAASWKAPSGMPAQGNVYTSEIPASGDFSPRPAWIYVPPAYLSATPPVLPVLVLMAGQPGQPGDWFTIGRVKETMDAWAANHQGLAPVVVVADPLSSDTVNPLCSDAAHGDVATYLQKDVPAWIAHNLKVDPDHSRWAIGGLSNGATCALQVATRAPQVYTTVLSMSGEEHPTLGSEERTISEGFGGDRAAYQANDPLTLLGTHRYEGLSVLFSVGADDSEYLPGVKRLAEAARGAGMSVEERTYPGTHSWQVWTMALAEQVDWLAARLQIIG
ncbi:esterase [Schaalia sp. 19OD2882]|uniref:alpha/beta hydrolase n=1 Tax=Schaalia sp. 19OD2882 TaxID=2794089 RepID=UPI001C1F17C3|nr:alpha/beta hydrolase-fold protein [Schaalia sp. 19OD2882]QWW20238.1 esterase [Schaalia sp. 19OD2882]